MNLLDRILGYIVVIGLLSFYAILLGNVLIVRGPEGPWILSPNWLGPILVLTHFIIPMLAMVIYASVGKKVL